MEFDPINLKLIRGVLRLGRSKALDGNGFLIN